MRQETNNEMDLLLRRLSRRQGVPLSDTEARDESDHLDADELNSYAENVLPAAARARYTEHLAECTRCRELVVQLSASVPVVAAREMVTPAEPSGLRKFLASFFSPMVLRYAVPALGVIVVAAIGFVLFRNGTRRDSVAQLSESTANRPSSAPAQNQQSPLEASGFHSPALTDSQPQAANRAAADQSRDVHSVATPDAAGAGAGAAGRVESNAAAPVQKTEAPVAANEPPAAVPKPAPTVDEMRVEVEGRRPAESVRVNPGAELARQRADNSRDQEKKAEAQTQATAGTASTPKAKTPDTRAQRAEPEKGDLTFAVGEREKDKDDGVTRNVGGRRFRRQSGVWVDTAYDSGSAIVNVRRGTEQYRALIGDEPGIKTIADQLEGTVIVVWKDRTYRIR